MRARVDALDDLRQFGLDAVVLEHDAQMPVLGTNYMELC